MTTAGATCVLGVACGSSSGGSAFDGGTGDGSGGEGGNGFTTHGKDSGISKLGPPSQPSSGQDGGPTADAFFAMDPPLMYCGFDGGKVASPGGTLECPDDKNREGCPCGAAGTTAACWPGLRKDRDIGICHDGTTTCEPSGEGLSATWGPCLGYQLPTAEAGPGTGSQACQCFSSGQWLINNISPCFVLTSATTANNAVSTYQAGDAGGAQCPDTQYLSESPPVPQPGEPWSTDSLEVDCAGNYKLCYTLKAGSGASPKASDCTVVSVCTQAHYTTAKQQQAIPPLPGWTASDPSCAAQFNATGGYGVMTVQGESEFCETVDNGMGGPLVFNIVQYCPSICDQMNPPADAGCANCMQGGSGMFQ